MSEEHIQRRKQQAEMIAERFEAMAARIRANGTDNFGGAFMVAPPNGAGEAVELMTLATTNPGHFWMMVKAHVDEQYKAMQDLMARQMGR